MAYRAGLVIVLLVWAGVAPAAARELTQYEALARDILRELVEIDTTHSSGDTTVAAEAMAARLLAAGFPAQDVQVIVPAPRKGNLVARLRSPAPAARPILLLAHLDVVEADRADWTMDPFVLLERDGYFYGRGTLDDKNEAAIHVTNLIRWKAEGYRGHRDIIVALTADEEGGPDNGVQHLLAQHRELIDAAFALNEGGGGMLRDGRRIAHAVQAAEKTYQSFHLEVTNPGGHSSLPRADNAINQLAHALLAVAAHEFPVRLNEVTRAYFRQSAGSFAPEEQILVEGLLREPPAGESVRHFSAIPAYNARIRTTCVATELAAGHAENALPQRARATVNCRVLPDEDPADVQAALVAVIGDPEVSVTPIEPAPVGPPSPLSEEIMAPITEVSEAMWPGVPVVPVMSTGATDGLFLRQAGIPVYGVSGVFYDIDDNRAHGRDERVGVEAFYEGLEFMNRLVRAFASPDRRAP
jgi:acetylornithine deacetylase/succinyl-diaminopimelate desuccinylase-like protein